MDRRRGFTLLEVMMAMTLAGFLLGGLFTLVVGSKQLSWRSEASLQRAVETRARINWALLQDDYSDVPAILEDDDFEVLDEDIPEPPLRKTQSIVFALQPVVIEDTAREETVNTTRWLRLSLPQ